MKFEFQNFVLKIFHETGEIFVFQLVLSVFSKEVYHQACIDCVAALQTLQIYISVQVQRFILYQLTVWNYYLLRTPVHRRCIGLESLRGSFAFPSKGLDFPWFRYRVVLSTRDWKLSPSVRKEQEERLKFLSL